MEEGESMRETRYRCLGCARTWPRFGTRASAAAERCPFCGSPDTEQLVNLQGTQ